MSEDRLGELVQAYLRGEAAESDLEELRRILESGGETARRAAAMILDGGMISGWFRAESDEQFVREALAAVGTERNDSAFVRRTLQRIAQTSSRRRFWRRSAPAEGGPAFLAAAAAVLLVAGGLLWATRWRGPRPALPEGTGGPSARAATPAPPAEDSLRPGALGERLGEKPGGGGLREVEERPVAEVPSVPGRSVSPAREETALGAKPEDRPGPEGHGMSKSPEGLPEKPRKEGRSGTTTQRVPLVLAVSVERLQGEAFVVAENGLRPARAGEPVYAGQGLLTSGPKSALAVVFADGTRVELGPETSISEICERRENRGKLLHLKRGSLTAQVVPQPPGLPMVLVTEPAEVTVLGTRLTLSVIGGRVRLDVREGRARLTRRPSGPSVEVPPGFFAVAGPDQDPELRHDKAVTLSFQDGVSPWPRYAGTRDCYFGEHKQEAERNNGTGAQVWVDGDCRPPQGDDRYALLRWDLTAIPPGSTILSAGLSIMVVNHPNGQPFHLFEMKRDWVENQATWNLSASKRPWQVPGARGPQDRGEVILGSLAPRVNGPYTAPLNGAGVNVVQSWVNNPASNFGFWLGNPENGDALGFESRESPQPTHRPRLTVVFVPRGR